MKNSMRNTFVFRVTGEICFYFSILHVFETYRGWWMPLAIFAGACFALGFLIVRLESMPLRLLLSLLPGLAFLLIPLQPLLFFPGLAWLYYILVMAQGNYAMPLEEYRGVFRFLLLISLFFIAANITNSTLYRGELVSVPSLVYVFLFMLLGLYAMRRMQMGGEMSAKWQLSNAAATAGIPLLAVGVSILLFLIVRFTQPLLQWLLTPLGRFILWLMAKLFPSGSDVSDPFPPSPTPVTHTSTLPSGIPFGHGADTPLDPDLEQTSALLIERAAGIGAYVLMGLLLLLALYLVLQYVKRNRPDSDIDPDKMSYDEGEKIEGEGKKRRNKAQRMVGNAKQLRRIYQTYLEFVSTKGLEIDKADTSQEILERAKSLQDCPQAERLRQLYIAARYGDPKAVTREQVQEAQECLEKILDGAK